MAAPSPELSVVIPVRNEAAHIGPCLEALAPLRRTGAEVIVVDGGSADDTVERAKRACDRVIAGAGGRGGQLAMGLRAARGRVVMFLHVDTRLPEGAMARVLAAVDRERRPWGRFDVRLSGTHPLLRVVERAMNLRSCITGIATGDQAIFACREVLEAIGGVPAQPLMEDIELSRRLGRIARPLCLRPPVVTSSRRWERQGILATVLLMWVLRAGYALGVSPARLARWYPPCP